MCVLKKISMAAITLIAYLIQTTLLHYFEVWGVVPNLLLIIVICVSLREPDMLKSIVYSCIAGALLDFSTDTIFGLNTLLCMTFSVLCNLAGRKIFKRKFAVNMLFVFIISIVYEFLYYMMSYATSVRADISSDMINIALPGAVYNTVVSMLIFVLIKRIIVAEKN